MYWAAAADFCGCCDFGFIRKCLHEAALRPRLENSRFTWPVQGDSDLSRLLALLPHIPAGEPDTRLPAAYCGLFPCSEGVGRTAHGSPRSLLDVCLHHPLLDLILSQQLAHGPDVLAAFRKPGRSRFLPGNGSRDRQSFEPELWELTIQPDGLICALQGGALPAPLCSGDSKSNNSKQRTGGSPLALRPRGQALRSDSIAADGWACPRQGAGAGSPTRLAGRQK